MTAVLDERWGPDEQALADGLRGLLEKSCDSTAVRAAEDDPAGSSAAVDAALDGFGLWDLPADPALLAA
ncbi:MAG: hypothetical protein M3Z03_01505, partial [Actinomycetota bacterium]|nr:hypothetical protein [Actinomycetota bacterium]